MIYSAKRVNIFESIHFLLNSIDSIYIILYRMSQVPAICYRDMIMQYHGKTKLLSILKVSFLEHSKSTLSDNINKIVKQRGKGL